MAEFRRPLLATANVNQLAAHLETNGITGSLGKRDGDAALWFVGTTTAQLLDAALTTFVDNPTWKPPSPFTPGQTVMVNTDGTLYSVPSIIPSGVIVMWSGLLSAIPSGWLLCDGQNGTPDLRGKFIKGALAAANPGVSGGAATHTHANHAVTQPGAHAFTQPGAHSAHVVTQPGAHPNHVVTQPGAHSNHAVTQPNAHAVTQAGAHSAHVVTQAGAHVVTQPGAHSNHSVTQPNAHTDVLNHVHVANLQGGTTGTTTGTHLMGSAATGGSLRAAGQSTANPTAGGVASQAHAGSAVDAHSAHSGTAVDAHAGAAVDAHSAHSGTAVDAHAGAAVDAHSAHSGSAVDAHSAHSGTAVDAHSAHTGGAVDAHSGTAVDAHSTVSSEPAFFSLAYIQKT